MIHIPLSFLTNLVHFWENMANNVMLVVIVVYFIHGSSSSCSLAILNRI